MRSFAPRALLVLFGLGAAAWPARAAEPDAIRPNIVFILADDMGYGDPGFMGSQDLRTPRLDELARGGAILASHYVQPCCSPTRAALMTGRFVSRTGVYQVVRPNAPWGLPLAERALPQALREAGYETAIVGKWHLGEFQPDYLPTRRGFDHQYGPWFGMIDYFTHRRGDIVDWRRDDRPCDEEGYSTHLLAKEACRLIRQKDPAKPLFLYLPFNAVHGPLQVPESYQQPFAQLTGARRTYAGMVAAMDEAIGQVVAALEEQKIRDNTLIIFSSDNGGPSPGRVTDNGPLRAGKGTLYEGGVRVCAAVNWPGRVPAGKTIREPIHAVDWYPTLIQRAGGSLEQKLPIDGVDLWPVLTQGARSPREALPLFGTSPTSAAIRVGDWKLLASGEVGDAGDARDHKPARQGQRKRSTEIELYNLADDLGEKHNLATANRTKARELRERLEAIMKDAVPSLATASEK